MRRTAKRVTDHYHDVILVTNDAGLGAVRDCFITWVSSADEIFANIGSSPMSHPVSCESPGRASPYIICTKRL